MSKVNTTINVPIIRAVQRMILIEIVVFILLSFLICK
jgi:hypothetical protein